MAARRRSILVVTALLACAALPAAAQGAVYKVEVGGTDVPDCTVTACATVQYAIEQHRLNPDPSDVIEVGPGTFTGNVGADDLDDDGLTIRGTLSGDTRQTTLRGEDFGFDDFGPAVLLGNCGPPAAQVTLRDVNVDTAGADSTTFAIETDGGSDLVNVHASNQPASDAGQVVFICHDGTTIDRSTIDVAGSSAPGDFGIFAFEGFTLRDSHVQSDSGPGLYYSGFAQSLLVRRSWIELDPANTNPGIVADGDLVVDSSLITGGDRGIERDNFFGTGGNWRVRNATIDVGDPGVYDAHLPDLLLWAEDGDDPIDVIVVNSILAEVIESLAPGAAGPGSVKCRRTDRQDVDLDPTFTNDCLLGVRGNAATPPAGQFVGGSPLDRSYWSLLGTAPAVDAGTLGALPPGYTHLDIAGNPRLMTATAACPAPRVDMGAYEYMGPPCNTRLPGLRNGSAPSVGTHIGSHSGAWSNEPTSFKNQFLRCDAAGDNCNPIMAYRSNKVGYIAQPADVGSTLRVRYIGTNAAGDSLPAVSAPSGVVTP